MVKKSSFLNKIVGRFRGGALRVADDRQSQTNGAPLRAANLPAAQPMGEDTIPESQRKLSNTEAVTLTMTKSFRELSTLLRGVQTRMEDQGGKLDTMSANVAMLPAAAQAQVELLRSLVSQLEKQNSVNGRMVETFAELPAVMKGVQESLSRTAATDERTARTLDDFKRTMDTIQGSIGDMVSSSQASASAATSLAKDHKDTVRSLESATQDGLEALRRAQEDQANRMNKIVGETGRWNRAIVVMLILSFGALVAILAAMISTR